MIEWLITTSQQDLWAIVQWQVGTGNWHDVPGWRGKITSNEVQYWWIVPDHLESGLFRWLVYDDDQATVWHSEPFYLPSPVKQCTYNKSSPDKQPVIRFFKHTYHQRRCIKKEWCKDKSKQGNSSVRNASLTANKPRQTRKTAATNTLAFSPYLELPPDIAFHYSFFCGSNSANTISRASSKL